jgi:DNA gyrase subunit A
MVLNTLYKYTQLQSSFSVNNIALVKAVSDVEPERYDSFCGNIMMWLSVERDMNCVKQRKEHILEGLIIASDNIDDYALIKSKKY